MTKRQRAQVVELLRCAADQNISLGIAACYLGLSDWHRHQAFLPWDSSYNWFSDYREQCLEAAARVEEGSWP